MMLLVEEKVIDQKHLAEIEVLWRELTPVSDHHFFTSWWWIGAWLRTSVCDPRLLMFYHGENLVGAACIHYSEFKRNAFVWTQANLNRTGETDFDQVWIEYNDVLAHPDYQLAVRQKLVEYVFNVKGVAEFRFGLSLTTALESMESNELECEFEFRTKGYLLNLRPEYADFEQLLPVFSSNTRSQIRRSRKAYSNSYGELEVVQAANVGEALDFFDHAGRFHQRKWDDSGFQNRNFKSFHHDLIANAFDAGMVSLLKVTAGDQELAYLYNFIYRGRVYFYLSGINYDLSGNQFKPGVLSHTLAISWYAAQGLDVYDFLAGDARYKRSLSDTEYDMALLSLKKKTIKTSAYKLLKRVRTQVKRGLNNN
ncbi:GNAT family N-acetyltransferase [Hahella ganghwensis]|uniref:GNAT family N-acetyltransferase n=1 Tax=Hahella ganghwensis TaxID=286420 RepID=UPI00039E5035|nr:GNAT family N-acetyltransferase [Hahella ganghwensis]